MANIRATVQFVTFAVLTDRRAQAVLAFGLALAAGTVFGSDATLA